MDTTRIDTILAEILSLDPTLKAHEADLRVLIETLDMKRPEVPLDAAFVLSLRNELTTPEKVRVESPYMHISWWAARLVPLGAVALLLFVLVPPTRTEPTPVSLPSEDPHILNIEIGGTPLPPQEYGGGAGDISAGTGLSSDSSMSMKSMESGMVERQISSEQSGSITLSPQPAGFKIQIDSVNTKAAGFVVLYAGALTTGDEPSAVSPLIYPGTTSNVPLILRERALSGESYTVQLYFDNGDRQFDPYTDTPETDTYGNMLFAQLIVN
jgi:hypothetical protein